MEINDDNTIVVTTTRGCMTIKKRVKIPNKLSELENDSGYIVDSEYVHTDNNFTDSYKSQVDKIDKLGAKLEYGEIVDNRRPIYLRNLKNEIISTIWVETGDYITSSITRKATAEDVLEAAKTGVEIEEGDTILIMYFKSGYKIFVNLEKIAEICTFKSTNTIVFSTSQDNVVSADVKVKDNKIISIDTEGLTGNIQVIRDGEFIKLYGKSISEENLLGKFQSPNKELLYGLYIENITEEQIQQYPPNYVDWKKYDSVSNPVNKGGNYYILFYKLYSTLDEHIVHTYYISLAKMSSTVSISSKEGNLLTDENDGLYVSIDWHDVID